MRTSPGAVVVAFLACAAVVSAASTPHPPSTLVDHTAASPFVHTRRVASRVPGGRKLLIGYFFNLYKYDPKGGRTPLPPNVTSPVQLLEAEMDNIIPLYDVVIQAFISPSQFNGTAIEDSQQLAEWRDGVNGSMGLKALCAKHNVPLMVSMGGGGAARFVNNDPALIDAIYNYAVAYGYAGVDIDEENTVPTDVYVGFLTALGTKLRSYTGPGGAMNISCTIGPLSCCVQSRGICKAAPYIDWAFMMLYDGLVDGGGWSLPAGSTQVLWQASAGQEFCGIKPEGPQQHGIVSDVGSGACEFLNFALYMNWPADKIVFGMPLYSNSPIVPWYQAMEQGFKAGTSDPDLLMTPYSGSPSTTEPGNRDLQETVYLISPTDVAARVRNTLSAKSVLGVTLDNSGWQSKLLTCGKFDSNSTHVGASVLGAGFWQMSFEDHLHHEVSTAARMAMRGLDTQMHS